MLEQRIGLIGAGQMATALANGLIKAKLTTPDRIVASDVDATARQRFENTVAARTTADNAEVASQSDVLVLAIKPQHLAAAAIGLRDRLTSKPLIISIAAGVRLATLVEWLGSGHRLVRVMPNTPCLIGEGACAYSLGEHATADDGALVGRMLGALGSAWQVDERQLDAVTGLSGSGPAFVYLMIEALSDGGVRMGLPRAIATQLAAKTVSGSAAMVLQTGEHPAVLKDRVTSPGGTTIAGVLAMESGGVRAALMAAVEAAARRSQELGGKS
ncbi:MAG: pyrroline-5-carboxylate reductase [Thermoguttaceae bacterium]